MTQFALLLAVAVGTAAGPTRSAVFVKTPKCGGTTISQCFINHANDANLAIYHATGPFVLNEAKVRAAKAALADNAGAGFGLLYNHGGRKGWINGVMAGTPKYFAVIRDPVARARSVILHGRGKAYLKAHPNSFCNEFRTNEAAVRGCWELRRNFIYIYLAPCAALTFEFCGQGNRKECTWCGAPSTGECMARSHASDPCVVAVSTTGPSLPSGRGNTPTAAGLPLPEPRCECVGGGVTARCSNAEIVTCIGERYAMLLPLELINEARALLVLDHGFTVPDVMCTERSQHNGRAPGHSALASAESRVPLPDVKAFFTATERQELLDNNPVDMLLHRYAVGAIEARIKAHGDRFNQTLTLVAGFVGKAEHECNLTKEHNWGFAGKLRKFEAQYQCFKDLYANSSGYEK